MRVLTIVACLAAAPFLSAASQPVRLQPSSPWIVDYAENSCRLIRRFGEGATKTRFGLESEAPGKMDMLIIGKPLKSRDEEIPAKFIPVQGKPVIGHPARADDNGDPAALWPSVDLPPDEPADVLKRKIAERKARPTERPAPIDLAEKAQKNRERQVFVAQVRELEIDARGRRPVMLELGSLVAPIAMLDKCTRDSLRDWGVDPEIEDRIARPVWPVAPWKWFSASDYPTKMLVKDQESVVKARLLIDATGRVTKCTSLSHFKWPEFGQVVCAGFVERAHFAPAELADGTKVPSYYVNSVNFVMPQ